MRNCGAYDMTTGCILQIAKSTLASLGCSALRRNRRLSEEGVYMKQKERSERRKVALDSPRRRWHEPSSPALDTGMVNHPILAEKPTDFRVCVSWKILWAAIIIWFLCRPRQFHKCLCAGLLVMLIPLLSVLWLHSVSPVDAHATRDNVGCGFHLSCSGAFNGSIGEKSSGQARASGDVSSPSLFTWFGDAFADQQGSGCWWTRTLISMFRLNHSSPHLPSLLSTFVG